MWARSDLGRDDTLLFRVVRDDGRNRSFVRLDRQRVRLVLGIVMKGGGEAGRGQLGKVALDHPFVDDGRAGQHLHPAGAEVVEGALRADGQGLQAGDVFRPVGRVHLTGRDHRGHAAVHRAVDPADLVQLGGDQSPNTGCTGLWISRGATQVCAVSR